MQTWLKWLTLTVIAHKIVGGLKHILLLIKQRLSWTAIRQKVVESLKRVKYLFPNRDQWVRLGDCFRDPRHLWPSLKRWWRHDLNKENQHLFKNLLVGLLIAGGLHCFHHGRFLTTIEDAAMDWMIQMFSGTQPDEGAIPFVWLNIDEETYSQWDEPLYTPRDKLKRLIEFAAENEAKTVIVDIDLARHSDQPAKDQILENYLAEYPANCQNEGGKNCPPIILARTFRTAEDIPYQRPRTSFLEEEVNDSAYLYWGSPLYERDEDWVIRHWRLWEPVCTDAGEGGVIPSIQLLAVTLWQGKDPKQKKRKLEEQFAPETCDGQHDHPEVSQDRLSKRIFYALPWQSKGHTHAQETHNIPNLRRKDGSLWLHNLPAHLIPEENSSPQVSSDLLKGRVVVIGGSFSDSKDIHLTPLGDMPGALIIMNAIHSLAEYREIESISLGTKILVEAMLIVLMSIAFAICNSFWGMVVSGMFIIVVLLPISFLLFRSGIWLTFAIPLLAVQLHQMAAEFEEGRKAKHGHCPEHTEKEE